MRSFMDDNFLLQSPTAERLYHDYARDMPIIDYHCHIPAAEIAANSNYKDIAEIWLKHDHYKWRAMRSNGIEERFITGSADARHKFEAWTRTMPYCIGNPLYHWTHLELKRYFGIEQCLNGESAQQIWDNSNELLKGDDYRPQSIIKRSNVDWLCTTDDPADDLAGHEIIRAQGQVRVYPTFRPDKYVNIENRDFIDCVVRLGEVVKQPMRDFSDFLEIFDNRIEYFASKGCFLSDHALEYAVYADCTERQAEKIFAARLRGESLGVQDIARYKTFMLQHCAREYVRRGWAMQIHIGAIRNLNSTMFDALGPDSGFDAIGDAVYATALAALLDGIQRSVGDLPKTIIYNLNPRDNEVIGSIVGCFQGGIPGKIQFGSGWWFCDQKDGMTRQMTALGNLGLLGRFIGMLTDSRSVLSYTRHEYFRRIACNLIGGWVENGEYPADWGMLERLIRGISYQNAKDYFQVKS